MDKFIMDCLEVAGFVFPGIYIGQHYGVMAGLAVGFGFRTIGVILVKTFRR